MTTTDGSRPRRWWSSIRSRIVVGYVVLLAVALSISILLTYEVLMGRLDREIERSLAQEVEELRGVANGTDPVTGEPFGDDVRAVLDTFLRRNVPVTDEAFYTLVGGERFLASFGAPQEVWNDPAIVAQWEAAVAPTGATVSTDVGEVRYLAVPLLVGDDVAGVFVTAHFTDSARDEILVVVRVLVLAGLVVLAASAALAWSLAGRVLRPVRQLTATAQRITATDLSQRIDVAGDDELAELGATFNEMVQRLERGFENQRQFLDDVAHELRTPITIVQGHVDLLGDDPDERADGVAVINDELERMNRYVNDLMLLAKAESGDFLQLEPVDLGELATTVEQRLPSLGEREWVVDAAPAPGTLAVLGDRDRLVQALLNLVVNAVQHTDPGDLVGIGIAADAQRTRVRMWVRDRGPGLDPSTIEQVFTRRYRSAASRARRTEGAGIGLSIVDAIARGHGGRAIAANEPNGGARFTIELPIDPPGEELP